MKRTIIVKKSTKQRMGINILVVFLTAILGTVVACSKQERQHVAILLFVSWLPFIILVIYINSWKVSFSDNAISKRVFCFTVVNCSYIQLKDAVISYSYTEYGYILLRFSTGRSIRFRLEDENASKAISKIRSHCSIRISRHAIDLP